MPTTWFFFGQYAQNFIAQHNKDQYHLCDCFFVRCQVDSMPNLFLAFTPCRTCSKLSLSRRSENSRFYNDGLQEIYIYIYICLQKYCILVEGELSYMWIFQFTKNFTDNYRFPTVHMVKTHFLWENLWVSKSSLDIYCKRSYVARLSLI